ncbi:peptidoglycan-binding protein [Streptomyces sp. NPDC012746]|uniref:peptidoglycan-binding protein n=1 Tax=Streptomyces sp. NPDC012746 TaxID=3364845 RepID=UPI0036C171BC
MAAETGPPAQGVLTAEVERRVLAETVVMRGTVVADQSVAVAPPGVVTKLPLKAGDAVGAGRLLAEVSGRPVFALHGAVPMYRDLKPGATGDDVAQVQAALRELGHGTGRDPKGVFGPGTKSALTAVYDALGYTPAPALPDGPARLKEAREAVRSAEWALEDADRSAGGAAATGSAGGAAAGGVSGSAGSAADGSVGPGSAAKAGRSGLAGGAAGGGGSAKDEDADFAARAAWPAGQTPGTRKTPAAAGESGSAGGRPGGATADGGAATAGGSGSAGKSGDVGRSKGPAPGGGSGSAGDLGVTRAGEALGEAREALAAVEAAEGPMLPAGEVVFLRGFPARVASVAAQVGVTVSGPVLTVSAGELVVEAYLKDEKRQMLRPGMPVVISSELDGTDTRGEVAVVAGERSSRAAQGPQGAQGAQGPQGGADGGGEMGYRMVVRSEAALPAGFAGQDVRLTVESAATDGPALVVPVTALSAGADGRTVVTARAADGAQHRVEVRTGTSGDGFVAVTPVREGALAAGARVVVGTTPAKR